MDIGKKGFQSVGREGGQKGRGKGRERRQVEGFFQSVGRGREGRREDKRREWKREGDKSRVIFTLRVLVGSHRGGGGQLLTIALHGKRCGKNSCRHNIMGGGCSF